jgi:hypothetical protein
MKRWAALAAVAAVAGGCATSEAWKPPTTRDTGDVPAALRPGSGNVELHVWSPLVEPEAAALRGLEQARQGDAHALLALAILASGDHRDAASYERYRRRVDQFLAEIKPTIDAAADDWHRGYELHRAMHRVFFAGAGTELGGYDFYQARVSGIFDGGHYNCLSSAMLFAVLARGVGLPVRAALLPTHVFIEMGQPGAGGKIIEIETTSPTGFDWIHDERFYKERAARWSGDRGLRPVTLEEYQHRTILEPYQLMAQAMIDSYRGEDDATHNRRNELAGVIDPDNPDLQKRRMQIYDNDAHDLFELKAWRTMVKLFDSVRPAVADIGAKARSSDTLQLVSWANWYHADALLIVGRQDEAIALMAAGLEHLDGAWPDASKLKDNYVGVLVNRLGELIVRKDYPTAVTTFGKYGDVCRSSNVCVDNASIIFANWSIDHQNAGDWQSARHVLQDCVSQLPGDSRCRDALADLESRHRF